MLGVEMYIFEMYIFRVFNVEILVIIYMYWNMDVCKKLLLYNVVVW